ncbi:MAG TPA: prolyl oligopeptidase family serine peptidase [Ferruginibacter sp.]|nr:prolyl oligopeptidase family serine peptidase [Ferruginibacter sp.]HRE62477.1 prolyl oligopeptidase family serine peptidase [Ferruginibacter sp.]
MNLQAGTKINVSSLYLPHNNTTMIKQYFSILFLIVSGFTNAQKIEKLTVEKIMSDPKWIGSSPSSLQWSADGKYLFFNWNPNNEATDSLYFVSLENRIPQKASVSFARETLKAGNLKYNKNRNAYVYIKNNDIFYTDLKRNKTIRIVETIDIEHNPQFSFNDSKIVYTRNQNLYAWDISSGETKQLTRIGQSGTGGRIGSRERIENENEQEKWLRNDQLAWISILKERKEKKEARDAYYEKLPKDKEIRSISISDKNLQSLGISPDGRFVHYRLYKSASGNKGTIVPDYVTESGFTTDIPTRTKVGEIQGSYELFIFDRLTDSLYKIKADNLPGIKDLPDYVKDYPEQLKERTKQNENRPVMYSIAGWNEDGSKLLLDIHSLDNKDRWLALWDTATKTYNCINRQRDEAWIGGPGMFTRGWLNNHTIYFQWEQTGYSHLYSYDIKTGTTKSLTSGRFEVQDADLSNNKQFFYITTNEVHPGEKHYYRLPVNGGKAEKLTQFTGSNQVVLSPDEKNIAFLYSYSNKPTELYWMPNKLNSRAEQITHKATSPEFLSYQWRNPEVMSFTAADGAQVYARLYKPKVQHQNKPAVIFVHGAGYLQNAHKWWSSYYREYMFHNLLADEGYTVMDIDYRGSAGYGRDCRTGIYRHMGGKDLEDHVDAANWLIKNAGVSKDNIGIYGGSYGGFITLMAMFTKPTVFAAGAALRPVTDWAQYNHGYTSNILNEPYTDSLAYRRSSPLYFAEGLKGSLLMCHGMLDVNVHFQDVVKLSQRLIELGKNNWELAAYPIEDHGFVEPSSWTDEYKRILKLFNTVLKK